MESRPSKGLRRSGGPARRPSNRIGRIIEDFFGDPWGERPRPREGVEEWTPEIELAEEKDALVVRAEIPGVDPENLNVSLSGNLLTISGEKKEERTERGENLYHTERWYGSFQRTVPLPEGVDPDSVTSEYSNGVLTLRFRKEEGHESQKIPVTSAGDGGSEESPRRKRLKDVMTKDVVGARPEETIREVARRMKDLDLGAFPVCEEDATVVGMITDRDLAIRVLAEGRDPAATRVRDVMTPDLISCDEDATVEEAEEAMKEHKVRRLPIVDRLKKLVGFFSIGKVARTERPRESKEILKSVTEPPRARTR